MRAVRAESGVVNAVASGTAILIRDTDHYQGSFAAGEASVGEWAARSAGTWGNSIGVSICATATAREITRIDQSINRTSTSISISISNKNNHNDNNNSARMTTTVTPIPSVARRVRARRR